MLEKIKDIACRILVPPRNKWTQAKLEQGAVEQYKTVTGRHLDLDHPQLFSDKVIWYKTRYLHPDMGRIVDKYDFKEYIRERLGAGYTTRVYGIYSSLRTLDRDWDSFPKAFVLKSTLQSNGKFIKIIRDKDAADRKVLFQEMKQWLKPRNTLINSFCRAYHTCKPRILVEEYISQIDSDQLNDYKVFCFQGEPFCFYVVQDRFQDEKDADAYSITFYDLQWNRMDVQCGAYRVADVPKPPHMEEMIHIARKLSGDFPFLRVDFYDTGDKLYMSELTFFPSGGLILYQPEAFNKQMGDLFSTTTEKKGS